MDSNNNFIEINEITDIVSYLRSINWGEEYWLFGIGIFHIVIAFLAFLVNINIQIVLFSILLLLVYFSEFINEQAALYSYKFSKQQYFDSNGMFFSIIINLPILINCIFIITRWFMLSFDLMTKVKTAQLRQQQSRAKREIPANSSHSKND